MDVVSLGPLRVMGFVYRLRSGAFAQTVVGKVTFLLLPGECVLSSEQDEPNEEDNHWNDDPTRSVYAPSDRAPYKPRADVLLVGHAFAPSQQPVSSLMVRLVVGGELDKSIEVWRDRWFRVQDGRLLEGALFTKVPLRWERAAGGPETNNPTGIRFDGAPDMYGMAAIPNLQPPGTYISRRSDTFAPVCFAPIAAKWPGRAQKLGRHGAAYFGGGLESGSLPEDFDYSYFQAAPPDQQVSELRPNERLVLENLHPEHSRLVTSLPGLRPRAVVDRATGEREEIRLVADTLWIDTDRRICTLVWRGRLGLRHSQEPGRVTFWIDGQPMVGVGAATTRGSDSPRTVEGPNPDVESATTTLVQVSHAAKGADLPFVTGVPPATAAGGVAAELAPWLASFADRPLGDGTGTLLAPMVARAKDPLPFAQAPTAASDVARENVAPPPFHFASALVSSDLPLVGDGARPHDGGVAHRPSSRDESPPEVPPEVAPPPMIGPLAVTEAPTAAESKPAQQANTSAPSVSAPPGPSGLTAKEPPPEDFPLERCAALTARIARRKADKAQILEEEGLSLAGWAAIEKHWADAIRDETKKGRRTLLDRFDIAYVEQLEKERGPIEVREYAMLLIATERGTTDELVRTLQVPLAAPIRIERVWLRRLLTDPKLVERVDEAMCLLRQC